MPGKACSWRAWRAGQQLGGWAPLPWESSGFGSWWLGHTQPHARGPAPTRPPGPVPSAPSSGRGSAPAARLRARVGRCGSFRSEVPVGRLCLQDALCRPASETLAPPRRAQTPRCSPSEPGLWGSAVSSGVRAQLEGPQSSPVSPAGLEVLLPDPRPPLLRHGVRQRRRGRAVWPGAGAPAPGPSTAQGQCSRSVAGAGGRPLAAAQAARPAAVLPPVAGAGVPRGPGSLLRRRDRVGPGLPALGEERGLPRPQGGRRGRGPRAAGRGPG